MTFSAPNMGPRPTADLPSARKRVVTTEVFLNVAAESGERIRRAKRPFLSHAHDGAADIAHNEPSAGTLRSGLTMPRLVTSSQASTRKIPYTSWSPCPSDDDMDPRWSRVSFFAYCLGKEIHHRQWQSGVRPPGIRVDPGDWAGSLCRTMQIGGRDRPNARKAMYQLERAGILVIQGGTARVLVRPAEFHPELEIEQNDAPLSLSSHSPRIPLAFPLESSIENHSTPIAQSREEEIKEERERERAREEQAPHQSEPPPLRPPVPTRPPVHFANSDDPTPFRVGHEFMGSAGLRVTPLSPRELLEWIGSQPEPERDAVVRALAADSWVRRNKPGLEHIVKYWDRYVAASTTGSAPLGKSELQLAELEMRKREAEWKALRDKGPADPAYKQATQVWLKACEDVRRLRGEAAA